MWLLVGLPGVGKTTRARELVAAHGGVLLSPDEWALALFGTLDIGRTRDSLEAMLLNVAQGALRSGADVVLDFGLWGRDERTALRAMAADCGASCHLVHVCADDDERRARLAERDAGTPWVHLTLGVVGSEGMQMPTQDELDDGPLDDPSLAKPPSCPVHLQDDTEPAGYTDWASWARERWPGLQWASHT